MLQIKSELIVNMNEQKSLSEYKTPSYTLRAVRNYTQKNREKINSKWREKYDNNPDFREKEKKRLMERYYRKKQEKEMKDKNITQM